MANKEDKYSDNVDGPYYVDEQCIACGICTSQDPDHFEMSDDGTHAYVHTQPEGEAEVEDAEAALAACPVDAIGNDG